MSKRYEKDGTMRVPTGVPYMDDLLGGGMLPTGVYGLLGPIGSCKTMTAVQLMVASARASEATAPQAIKTAVMYAYEMSHVELRQRTLSSGTGLPTRTFAENSLSNLIRQETVRPDTLSYLKHLEYVVYDEVNADVQTLMESGIAGIAKHLEDHVSPGRDIDLVVIDYVGAIGQTRDSSPHKERLIVECAADDARRLIAEPFDCPVLLIHQYSGDANHRGKQGYRLRASHASASHEFAARLDACFAFGEPRGDTRIQTLECVSGTRRHCGGHRFVRLRGDICRMEEVGERVVIERNTTNDTSLRPSTIPSNGRIISADQVRI